MKDGRRSASRFIRPMDGPAFARYRRVSVRHHRIHSLLLVISRVNATEVSGVQRNQIRGWCPSSHQTLARIRNLLMPLQWNGPVPIGVEVHFSGGANWLSSKLFDQNRGEARHVSERNGAFLVEASTESGTVSSTFFTLQLWQPMPEVAGSCRQKFLRVCNFARAFF